MTDEEADGNALPLFASGKALVSHALYEQLWRVCDGGNFWVGVGLAVWAGCGSAVV